MPNISFKYIAAGVLIVIAIGYMVIVNISDYFTKDVDNSNAAVAAKANEQLKLAIEKNNEYALEIEKLKKDIEDRDTIARSIEGLIQDNNDLADKASDNIKVINNNTVTYVETKEDSAKSKIIIDEIWNIYSAGVKHETVKTNSTIR